ncbi:MAG: hypothetical protein J07HN4v3_03200, partial [Halonotius sp. J07HN4]
FNEITLIITSRQVVKHIGSPVWTEDFDTYEYASITDVAFEEGSVATTVVLTHDGRQDRFKIPNDDARAVREAIVDAVCTFHEVDNIDELRNAVAEAADDDPDAPIDPAASDDQLDFGEGVDPLGADPPAVEAETETSSTADSADDAAVGDETLAASLGQGGDEGSTATGGETTTAGGSGSSSTGVDSAADNQSTTADTTGTAGSTHDDATGETAGSSEFDDSESAGQVDEGELAETVATLAERIDRQEEQLAEQNELIETLIEELRRGR